MSMHGETRRMVMAPVGAVVACVVLAAMAGIARANTRAMSWLKAAGRVLEHRRVMARLAALDDHMLKDMGITRADVCDAVSEPLGADPTRLLVLRATERRAARCLDQRDRASRAARG
ncbi:DUF1127 domain-containing protein [Xanthobacter variabilis]|uniref:DUF1127 domain-containing protein n=1 Tax=Xanthobacter variabilis TaxID=3119932 RepID=UPI00372A9C80